MHRPHTRHAPTVAPTDAARGGQSDSGRRADERRRAVSGGERAPGRRRQRLPSAHAHKTGDEQDGGGSARPPAPAPAPGPLRLVLARPSRRTQQQRRLHGRPRPGHPARPPVGLPELGLHWWGAALGAALPFQPSVPILEAVRPSEPACGAGTTFTVLCYAASCQFQLLAVYADLRERRGRLQGAACRTEWVGEVPPTPPTKEAIDKEGGATGSQNRAHIGPAVVVARRQTFPRG